MASRTRTHPESVACRWHTMVRRGRVAFPPGRRVGTPMNHRTCRSHSDWHLIPEFQRPPPDSHPTTSRTIRVRRLLRGRVARSVLDRNFDPGRSSIRRDHRPREHRQTGGGAGPALREDPVDHRRLCDARDNAHDAVAGGTREGGATSKICWSNAAHRRVASVGASRGAGMIRRGVAAAAGSA